jgi:hypothetical protein
LHHNKSLKLEILHAWKPLMLTILPMQASFLWEGINNQYPSIQASWGERIGGENNH